MPSQEEPLATVHQLPRAPGPDQPDYAECTRAAVTGAFAPLEHGIAPALVLEFAHTDGTPLPRVVLILDELDLRAFAQRVQAEALQAISKARAVRSLQ